jgi:hypothetical protein
MLSPVHAIKSIAAAAAAAVVLVGAPLPSYAQTIGSVRIHLAKAGFIVGVGGGSGILHYRGRNHPLRVGGISVGTIGVARADLVGRAYNLRTAADIAGTYSAVAGSIAVAGGAKAARLQNANGVVLDLQGRQAGFEASLSLSGMNISLR